MSTTGNTTTDITFVVGRHRYEIDEDGKPLGGSVVEVFDAYDHDMIRNSITAGSYSNEVRYWRYRIETQAKVSESDGKKTPITLWHVLNEFHPLEQKRWVQFAADVIAGRCPLIVVTSHDHVVDMAADYDHVIVCWGKRWKRLSEHSDAARWKGELAAGEFWSMVGERWV